MPEWNGGAESDPRNALLWDLISNNFQDETTEGRFADHEYGALSTAVAQILLSGGDEASMARDTANLMANTGCKH